MAPPRSSFFHLLLSCFLLAATSRSSDAGGGAPQLQDIDCSTEGNYTATDAYAAKLNQLLATLPITTVSKNGGFFNGTVGQGTPVVVYGLAMCSADFSRPDCTDCLTAASSNATGLAKRCPGSVTASIMFDQCMIRYSNRSFFGTAETDIAFSQTSSEIVASKIQYSDNLKQGLAYLSAQAAMSPERFAASSTAPFALVQCTWDLPSDKCKACIDTLSANATNLFQVGIEGQTKTYSCRVRYSNASFTVVPLVDPAGG
ncbi:hypothetical protein BDA96_09G005100 [Sorghum bicolor]|uniref:Gnk2-homologous domain-containing protein n=1 Tax=Sorghum bicolor TaxID=4558 RepID=A0A921U3B5_SORBI|nr:hypothetical protein BDA96_09G005100 [Sorghum bicolor]